MSPQFPPPPSWSRSAGLSLRLEPRAVGGQGAGVGPAQHDAVPEQLEEHVVVAEEDEAQRQRVVPALGAQQRVQLVQNHAGLDPDQQVQEPQRLVEQELRDGGTGSGQVREREAARRRRGPNQPEPE